MDSIMYWVIISDPLWLQVAARSPLNTLSRITQRSLDEISYNTARPNEADVRSLTSPKVLGHAAQLAELWEFVTVREEFKELEDRYPGDFIVAGMWMHSTGEPVGGVGSPWFVTPEELGQFMPGDEYEDIIRDMGAAVKKFV